MGVAGWRFAHGKRNLSGRAAIVAVLKDWQVICSRGRLDDHARDHALQGLAAVSAKQPRLAAPKPHDTGAADLRRRFSTDIPGVPSCMQRVLGGEPQSLVSLACDMH